VKLSSQQEPVNSFDYAGVLRRNWWIVAAVVVVALVASLLVTALQTRRYDASALLAAAPSPLLRDDSDVVRSLETLDRRSVVATFARVAMTRETKNAALAAAGIPAGSAGAYTISASVVPHTNIIRIDASGPDARRAAALSNAAASVTAREARQLYRIYTLTLIAAAEAPVRAAYPDRRRNAVVAVLVGFIAGLVAAFAAEKVPRGIGR
jgi:capsular polysaccharide biosynthesis protein